MKTDVENRFIWYKGEIVNVNDAKINILSPTAQFGLNVFEGIPCYWNDNEKQLYAFRLDDHYNRLLRSARLKHTTYLHRVPNAPLNENALKLAEIQVFERCLKYGTSPDYTRKKKAEEPEMILNIKLAA